MQFKLPVVGLDEKDKHVCHPGLMELFYIMVLEKNDVHCWNEFILVIDNGGWKVKQG